MSDQARYILSAGHCFSGSGVDTEDVSGLRESDLALVSIGKMLRYIYNISAGQDNAIVHVSNTGSWGGGGNNTVYVMAGTQTIDGKTYSSTADESYQILAAKYTNQLPGSAYLCRTGTSSGTRCAPYLGTELDLFNSNNYYFDFKARVCGGDSGGPIYISHTAYGIVSGGVGMIAGCTTPNSSQYVYAQQVRTAMVERNVWLNGLTP